MSVVGAIVPSVSNTGKPLLVTDLDNTLWDWVGAWYSSFSALVDSLVVESGVEREVLLDEIREVHQRRHTTEYSNLIAELPCLQELVDDPATLRKRFDASLHAQNSARKHATKLYPTVRETLDALKALGWGIAAYTESGAYWTQWRITQTGLDGVIDVLYSAPDHDEEGGVDLASLRYWSDTSAYRLKQTRHTTLPLDVRKPNVQVLNQILDDQEVEPGGAIYVGDSLMKDIAMAQHAGVFDIHARYGESHERQEYELLRRVTHWSEEDVANEKRIAAQAEVVPTFILDHSIGQLLDVPRIAEASR